MSKHNSIDIPVLEATEGGFVRLNNVGGTVIKPATNADDNMSLTLGGISGNPFIKVSGRVRSDAVGSVSLTIGGSTYFSASLAAAAVMVFDIEITSYFRDSSGTYYSLVKSVYHTAAAGVVTNIEERAAVPSAGHLLSVAGNFDTAATASCIAMVIGGRT